MNTDLFVIIVCFLSLIIGLFIGIQIFKLYNRKQDKKLLANAEEVLKGNRENKIKIDGQEYDANNFRVRDENNEEIVIDLKGGGKIQNGRRQEEKPRTEEISEQTVEAPREISHSSRKNKRNIRTGSILSRIRRR